MRLVDIDALGIKKCKQGDFDSKEEVTGWNSVIEILETAPTVDAEPVRHGKWIDCKIVEFMLECSECHAQANSCLFTSNLRFCPNCGAKMDL